MDNNEHVEVKINTECRRAVDQSGRAPDDSRAVAVAAAVVTVVVSGIRYSVPRAPAKVGEIRRTSVAGTVRWARPPRRVTCWLLRHASVPTNVPVSSVRHRRPFRGRVVCVRSSKVFGHRNHRRRRERAHSAPHPPRRKTKTNYQSLK